MQYVFLQKHITVYLLESSVIDTQELDVHAVNATPGIVLCKPHTITCGSCESGHHHLMSRLLQELSNCPACSLALLLKSFFFFFSPQSI